MARFAYFADLEDGTVLEWRDRRVKTGDVDRWGAPRYRDAPAKVTYNLFLQGYDAERGWVKITRSVQLKAMPSRHTCDARCMNATGRDMACECACGGKNHGRGRFVCEEA